MMDDLEPRRMFNAATLKHGLLTIYGSDGDNIIRVSDTNTPAARSVTVSFGIVGTNSLIMFSFRSTGITRMRIFAMGGDDSVTLDDAYMPNMTDVAIFGGDGSDTLTDASLGHRFNRTERVSLMGEAGNDTLVGGDHTFSSDGGEDTDSVLGGAPGALLEGGDGDDLVAATPSLNLLTTLTRSRTTVNALSLDGGAGNDCLVGNYLGTSAAVTLNGGTGNDELFKFGNDTITDFGNGIDTTPAANQFVGNADVTQTATLSFGTVNGPVLPANGVGNVGAKPRIFISDANGTITMQGPAGSSFLLGDLLNVAGYPVSKLGVDPNVSLVVNGFLSSLTGAQIAGYQINNGDQIVLSFPT
jgi:Ca2+-binding RTX toxin-like protein